MLIPIVMAASLVLQSGYEALNVQANRQFREGRFEEAGQTYRLALEVVERQYGPDDPATAMILGNIAGTEHALGRDTAAEGLARSAIAQLEKVVGPASVLLVPSLNTLGGVYIDARRYDEAEAVFKRAIHLGSREGGAHYATSLHNLAAVYHLKGRAGQAAKFCDKALRIRLALFGPDDPLTKATARNIGTLDQASTRLARAAKSKPANSPR